MYADVIIFGATSYVAHSVIKDLLNKKYTVAAVNRNSVASNILLENFINNKYFHLLPIEQIEQLSANTLINFAYIKEASPEKIYVLNKNLVNNAIRCAKTCNCEKLIQISTQAVFGYQLPEKIDPNKAKLKIGDPYIETKIQAEHMIEKITKNSNFSISVIRLGNVIGPGSSPWISNLAQRIIMGLPVAYTNKLGYSNTSYTKNISKYLIWIIEKQNQELRKFGIYHHLAEFSDHSWKEILELMADSIGINYIIAKAEINNRKNSTLINELLIQRLFNSKLKPIIKLCLYSLPKSLILSTFIDRLRQVKFQAEKHNIYPTITRQDQELSNILSEEHQFKSHVLPDWKPIYSFDYALSDISNWLIKSLYGI